MVGQEAPRAAFYATRELASALRRLGHPAKLDENPLARTAAVRARAAKRYGDHAHSRGMALRDLLIETIARVDHELAAQDQGAPEVRSLRPVLRGLVQGDGVAAVGRELGLSPCSHSGRMLYRAQHMLVRRFLIDAGLMARPTFRSLPRVPSIAAPTTAARAGAAYLAG